MTDQTPTATPEPTPSASPAAPATPAPRSDAEAAQQKADTPPAAPAPDAAKKDADAEKERQRNRTREYIAKLNRENAELRAQLESGKPKPEPAPRTAAQELPGQDGEPKPEDFNFDMPAYLRAHSKWAIDKALAERENTTRQTEATTKQRESVATYNAKAVEFAEDHEDFFEVVGSMDVKLLTPELQFAIMGHENGPGIAYHLAKNEDELWNLASIRADLLPAAVARLASRLSAAPKAPEPSFEPTPKPQPPVSKAPAPAPTVSGRTPTDTPPEKLTDDEWFKRERERSRKR